MPLIDLSHTSHTRVQTGIQVVCRSLYAELAKRQAAQAITWDHYAKTWRELDAWEEANLNLNIQPNEESAPRKRRAQWPLYARLRGRWRKHCGSRAVSFPNANGGLIVPELFDPHLAPFFTQLPVTGPRVALFYDAIPLKFPELSPTQTVAFFPSYLQSLLQFDGIAAISEDSAQTLRGYFHWLGVAHTPEITAIPLGVSLPAQPVPLPLTAHSQSPTILSVGSIEGRKNHLALLAAAESLWAQGRQFTLHIIGLAQAETGRAALKKITELQAAGCSLRYSGHAARSAVEASYAECRFTVYPSIIEGFGLPVIESVARARPCICSGRGALGEVARGGGTLMLDEVSAPAIAAAIDSLLKNPDQVSRLTAEAQARRFQTWGDYTTALLTWMDTLRK